MRFTDISTIDIRKRVGDIFNRVHYRDTHFRVQRKGETLGFIVSEEYIDKVGEVVEYIIDNEPALADTLALSANKMEEAIRQALSQVQRRETQPIEGILNDD